MLARTMSPVIAPAFSPSGMNRSSRRPGSVGTTNPNPRLLWRYVPVNSSRAVLWPGRTTVPPAPRIDAAGVHQLFEHLAEVVVLLLARQIELLGEAARLLRLVTVGLQDGQDAGLDGFGHKTFSIGRGSPTRGSEQKHRAGAFANGGGAWRVSVMRRGA